MAGRGGYGAGPLPGEGPRSSLGSGCSGKRRAGGLALAAAVLAVSAPGAGASPIPAGKTVDARVMVAWPLTTSGVPASDAAFYRPMTIDAGVGLRLFMVKGELLVSVPSFTTEDVSAGDVSTRNVAFLAGRGSYRCKKARMRGPADASGRAVNFCVSYTPDANGFVFKFKYDGEIALNSRGFYDYALRFDIADRSCQVALRSGAMKMTIKTPNYDVVQSAKARAKSSSCTIIDGRQTF